MQILTGVKRTTYQGLSAYYPVLIYKRNEPDSAGLTIDKTTVYTRGGPLATRAAALKYADIYRKEEYNRLKTA